MASTDFFCSATGKSPEEAFRGAVDEAKWEHGHGGYTGTIAERGMCPLLVLEEAEDRESLMRTFHEIMNDRQHPCHDKWSGPVCCSAVKDEPGTFYFFGYASS